MLARILAAQSDVKTALSQLSLARDSALHAQVSGQLQTLAGLERAITSGNAIAITAIRGEIAAAVAASAGISQQARDSAQRSDSADLAAISIASRDQVTALMRDMHRFDPYLRFASTEDENEYRRREAERREYIEQQHARGTPEGNLNAAGAAVGQMVDAQTHGAGESPEFRRRWDDLTDTTSRLRDQVQRTGGSTRAFDDQLMDDLRNALRSRGLSEREIDARLAAHSGNPLAALREHMGSEEAVPPQSPTRAPAAMRPETTPATSNLLVQNLDEAMAEFRAAGIVVADPQPAGEPAHGLTVNERPTPIPGISRTT